MNILKLEIRYFCNIMEALTMTEKILENGKQFFEDYTQKILKKNDLHLVDSMQLKKEHSLRVAKLSAYIAGELGLDKANCQMAEFIGLLHDLGRFVQFEKYHSFDDQKTEDHAALSLATFKNEAFFKELSEEDQQLVISVVEQHNKVAVISKDKNILQFSQILRDADKLDIWEVCVSYLKRDGSFSLPSISLDLPNTPGVSDVVIKTLLQGKPVQRKDLQTVNDFKLFVMAMVFDLNYKVSFHLLNQKQLIKKIYDTLPKRDDVINIYRQIRLLVENKFVE